MEKLIEPHYKNLVSNIDIDRNINNIEYFDFINLNDPLIADFKQDIEKDNDTIELNLIRSQAYKEGVIFSLKKSSHNDIIWSKLLREEQRTFSGSKLFYLNHKYTQLLILSIPQNMDGKIKMVINRLNKINEKINRLNLKVKKDNQDVYYSRIKNKDKKDKIINLINQNLKV